MLENATSLSVKEKLRQYPFLYSLIYSVISKDHISLLDLKCEFEEHSCYISRTSIHKRFTTEAVKFLKAVLADQMTRHLVIDDKAIWSTFFNQICIKDSTKFSLPISMLDHYPGYGSYNKTSSLMNIQYEYDLLSGNWKSLELTKATRNDQADSKDTIDSIQAGNLYIRDLGYVTYSYLSGIIKKKAYYLNRLPHKTNVYQIKNGKLELIDWCKLHEAMKKQGLMQKEVEVYLGKNKMVKTRMIMFRVDKLVYEQRIRKASRSGQRKCKYNLTKEYKAKVHYSIFITNVPEQELSMTQVQKIYKLRWQIELIFKTWKSHLRIDKVKQMSKERFECQLFAKFIWILLYWRIFQLANYIMSKRKPDKTCSVQKFYQRAKYLSNLFKVISKQKNSISKWLETNLIPLSETILLEKKKNITPYNEILMEILKA